MARIYWNSSVGREMSAARISSLLVQPQMFPKMLVPGAAFQLGIWNYRRREEASKLCSVDEIPFDSGNVQMDPSSDIFAKECDLI